MNKNFSYIDLFSGCGGLSFAFSRKKQFECLFASDSWEMAGENYKINHPSSLFEQSDLSSRIVKKNIVSRYKGTCDIVMGGPPCQGFSTLGKRKVDCEKSILVDSFIQLATALKPRCIIMENVKAIRSKKHPRGGLVIENVMKILKRNGYIFETQVLNTLDYGLGQTRKRFFLFAFQKDFEKQLSLFLKAIEKQKKTSHSTLKQLIGDLPKIGPGGGGEVIRVGRKKIYNHQAMKHSDALVERFKHVPKWGGLLNVPKELMTNHLLNMVNGSYGSGGHVKNIYGRMSWSEPSGTIVAGMDKITIGRFVHPESHRLLTPRECARIQSFPDSFRFCGSLVTQYYLIGNAVPPLFSKVLATAFLKSYGAVT